MPTKSNNEDTDMESESSDSDEDDKEEGGGTETPVLQVRKVSHEGGVNRIRAMPQYPYICALCADTDLVQVWDFSSHLHALGEADTAANNGGSNVFNQAPLSKFAGHKDEGYAIDWSLVVPGRLVSGDCKNHIHLWEPASESTWNVDSTPFVGHTASVEDLQWSPTEPYIFASCSINEIITIWDTRTGKSPAVSIKAHKAYPDELYASISPHEASTLAVSSTDNQLTIWDLSLERDEEEEAEFRAKTKEQVNAPNDFPPQLLFVHQDQKDLKELYVTAALF
ncbi:protein HEAT STRESS TOLERANT DWD 1-like [Salvia divinorum]|uniref:Protein HEAT STRESS TOLERANT DWD 1-like n=1 Tax=Salvia divinorum TaxID=28513 RepID=A0ABD1GY44_SALDI